MKITVRRAKPEDVESIYNVMKLAFLDFRKIDYKEAAIQSAIVSKSEIQRRINEELMLVAQTDKKIVGTVTGTIEYESMHVKTLATHPGFQNFRVGTRLMEEIEEEAVETRCYKISLFTTPVMKSAIHLYEKRGYQREGVLKKQFHGIDLIAFGKILRE
jgi:ribosomal protein S18 acetylase RimI-like enzyme